MDVSVGTVSKWESAISVPDIETIVELADFFQESVDALLGKSMMASSPKSAIRNGGFMKTAENLKRSFYE